MAAPLSVTLGADISGYQRAMAKAGELAVRHAADIGSAFSGVAKRIDKDFLGLASDPGMTALARLPAMARTAAAGFIAFEAVRLVLNQTADAARAAQEQLDALIKIGTRASAAGVSTSFLQGWTQQARDLNVETSKLEAMLQTARDASTVRIGDGLSEATSTILDRLRQNVLAGNVGQDVLDKFLGAEKQEGRIRVILDLLDDLRAKGAQLAAFDLGRVMFGADFEQKLRSGADVVERMRRSLDGLAVAGGERIITEAEIARAVEINAQLNRARDTMANALRPIQEDLASWSQAQAAAYSQMAENVAGVAAGLAGVYTVLQDIGALLNQLGNAPFWGRLTEAAKAAGVFGNFGGTGTLEEAPPGGFKPLEVNVRPSGIAPANDRSKALPALRTPKAASAGAPSAADEDSVARFVRSMERANALLQVEIDTLGKGTVARERALAVVRAEGQAREDVARGKRANATLDDAERQRILATAEASGVLKDRLEKLRDAQADLKQASAEVGSALSDAFKGAALEGKSLNDVVSTLLNRLASRGIDTVFSSLFVSGGEGGLLGALFKGAGAAAGVPAFADGGMIRGPGTGRSDSILARVSAGEFVVNAAATARHRDLLGAINAGRLPAFADGGLVGVPGLPSSPIGAVAAPSITQTVNVVVNGQGGDPKQNADLADRVGRQVKNEMRALITGELRAQMRPGGILRA